MTVKSIARQYALAAFDVARTTQQIETLGQQLQAFADLVSSHADLQQALAAVVVPRASKRDLVMALIDRIEPVRPELRRLVGLLADNDRLSLLGDVAAAYQARMREDAGVVTADIVSATPIDQARQSALAEALGRVTGRRVELTGRVDESIIGGVIATVGGTVYDGSVSRQLARMRQRLAAEA
ncbi:MAG: ATP synthase F1 subunit delta [Acidobacteria bacterium SCN 69-37]|nr:MAG: ATP synthase F1 subunit delta [Acidobacteria bacterium SCN 69-37]